MLAEFASFPFPLEEGDTDVPAPVAVERREYRFRKDAVGIRRVSEAIMVQSGIRTVQWFLESTESWVDSWDVVEEEEGARLFHGTTRSEEEWVLAHRGQNWTAVKASSESWAKRGTVWSCFVPSAVIGEDGLIRLAGLVGRRTDYRGIGHDIADAQAEQERMLANGADYLFGWDEDAVGVQNPYLRLLSDRAREVVRKAMAEEVLFGDLPEEREYRWSGMAMSYAE